MSGIDIAFAALATSLTVTFAPLGSSVTAGLAGNTFAPSTATPNGGSGTYTYAWTTTPQDGLGTWSVLNPTTATGTPKVAGVVHGDTTYCIVTVTVTDTVTGMTASASDTWGYTRT